MTPLPASGSPSPAVLVEFAAQPGTADGGFVTRKAPVIFRAGRYDFQDAPPFEMSPADIKAAAERFEPVPLFDTHGGVTSVFRGKLGELVAAEPSADGAVFGGTVRVPKWLDDLFKGVALPLSATWDRATKRLKNVALLTNPRITDARLEAAFAAARPGEATTVPTNTTESAPAPALGAVVPTAQPDLTAAVDAAVRKREAEWEAEKKWLKDEAAQFAREFAAERDVRLLSECAAFADREGAGRGKDTRDLLAEFRFALATADREHGEATFSRQGAEPRKGRLLDQLDALVARFNKETPSVLNQDVYRGGAQFANDPGEKPGDEFKAVDAAVDAEIERQRKARGQQTNGRA